MNQKPYFGALLTITIFFISCTRPDCKNENPIFNKYPAQSKEYINELTKLLKNDATNISFNFDHYEKQQEKEYIFVNISGKKFCAKGKILVTDWKKIKDIQRTRGMGYSGAELVGFKADYLQDSASTVLVYKNVDHISD
jgi:hypothetical protein